MQILLICTEFEDVESCFLFASAQKSVIIIINSWTVTHQQQVKEGGKLRQT